MRRSRRALRQSRVVILLGLGRRVAKPGIAWASWLRHRGLSSGITVSVSPAGDH